MPGKARRVLALALVFRGQGTSEAEQDWRAGRRESRGGALVVWSEYRVSHAQGQNSEATTQGGGVDERESRGVG